MLNADMTPPAVAVAAPQDAPAPVRQIKPDTLVSLGQKLNTRFSDYARDRRPMELKWTKNLRQYLGLYDPEILAELGKERSLAYPRITRVKCISVLSRIMNLMFPGNERNWQLGASPSAEMAPHDIELAVKQAMERYQTEGSQPPQITQAFVDSAVQELAEQRAEMISLLIDDQLQEIGGDQTADYVSLNRKVAQSGINYGLGVLRGPFVRETKKVRWVIDPSGMATPVERSVYKPQYEFLPVWDFYPDLSAKTLLGMDGYFVRMVMTRAQVRKLADREDFFGAQIKKYLTNNRGDYKPKEFETELKSLGVKENVNDVKVESGKYEVIVWHGYVSGQELKDVGADVADDALADDIEAEVWMIGGQVIKADVNAWRQIDASVRTIHTFIFDEDDTSPIGNGLPNVMRDSAMSVAAATRMLLDNASVVCGPNMEVNVDLLLPHQDIKSVHAYKVWEREGTGPEAQFPAVRNVPIDGHLAELMKTVEMFMGFADMETFVGPATGGDMSQGPSEPMRTVAGASMIRGDAALPFKDIVRNFDSFTQSWIQSLVQFNRKFNPDKAPAGDFNVIARGATSLIAKEVRGMQVDQLSATLSPEERDHVDERKLVEARFAVRDMTGMLVSEDEAKRRQQARAQQQQAMTDAQMEQLKADTRKTLAEAFKNITQGQKNTASADAQQVNAGLSILEKGMDDGEGSQNGNAGG